MMTRKIADPGRANPRLVVDIRGVVRDLDGDLRRFAGRHCRFGDVGLEPWVFGRRDGCRRDRETNREKRRQEECSVVHED